MFTTQNPPTPLSRRTVALGAAWAVPTVVVAAPPAFAGASLCQVKGSVQVAPNSQGNLRAICTADSQVSIPAPASIYQNYGKVNLPGYLEICNCQQQAAWYRWQETDGLSNFQIEVEGVHNDQNGPGGGYRPAFYLDTFGGVGGCQRFELTYRTSVARSTTPINVSITFKLQTSATGTGGWTNVQTLTVSGTIWRTTTATVNFSSCTNQSARQAQAAPAAGVQSVAPAGSGD